MAKHLNVNLQFTADTSQAKAQIQSLQQSLTSLSTANISGKGMTGYTQDVTKAIGKVNELKSVLASATTSTGTLDLGKFNASMKKAGSSIDDYKNHLSQLGPAGKQAFAQLAQSISTASVPIKQSSSLLNEMATTLKNTARWQLTSSLLHGFMSSLQGAMSYAQGLDKSLTDIRIVSGMSADEMERFAVQANKSAQALSSTTKAYSDAALIYYQQGLSEADVKDRTDVTIKMANVTGEAAADVSSYMTAIWNNFNKEGQYAEEHFADIMTKLGAETAASTDEIAAGLSKFSAVADTVGLSFEMASSAVTAVVDQTREAPEVVGTAMKTIFSRVEGLKMGETLEDGVDLNKYSETLKKVGVDIFDATGELKDMDLILHDIGDKWEELGRKEQIALAQNVAGIRQYNQFMAIFDNWDKVEENLDMAAAAGGTLQEQADIYAESWEGARNRVKAAMEEIWGKVIDDDFFIGLNNFLADFLGVISEVIDSLGGMKGVLLMLSTLMMNVFGKSMAAGIDRFAYNIHLTSKKGQQEIEELRAKTTTAMSQMAKEMGNSTSGQAMSKTFLNTANIQDRILEQTKKIAAAGRDVTTEEQGFFNAVLETNQALSNQYIAIAKNRDALLKQNKNNEKEDIHNMRVAAGGDAEAKEGLNKNMKNYKSQKSSMQTFTNTSALGLNLQEQLENQINANVSTNDIKKYIQDYAKEINSNGIPVTNKFKKILKDLSSGKINITNEVEILRTEIDRCNGEVVKLENHLTNTFEKSKSTNNPKQRAEEARKSIMLLSDETVDLVNQGVGVTNFTDQVEEDFDNLNNKPFTLGQKITAMAGALSAVAMTISSINGMIDTLKDPDASGWEKFSAVLMTVGMVVPMLTSSFSKNNLQMIAGASASIAQALGFEATAAGAFSATGAVGSFGATLWATLWPIGLVMAAIAGLIVLFVGLYRHAHKAEREAAKATETAEAMNKQYETAKTELEEVNKELETLREKRNALKGLEEGTKEWNAALKDSNDYVLELLDKYPELAEHVYTDENGVLQITDAGMEDIAKRKEQEVEDARIASIQANVKANDAQKEANIEATRKNITYSKNAKGGTSGTQVEYTLDATTFDGVIDLVEKYGNNIPKDELMDVLGDDQDKYDAVIEYLPEIIALISENNALTKSSEIQSKEIGKTILEQAGDGDAKNADQLSGVAAQEYQTEYDKVYGEWENKGKNAIIAEYERLNPDMTLTNKNGGRNKAAEFKDASGNVVPVTVDEMLEEIASTTAMDRVADKWDKVADKFNRILDSQVAKDTSGDVAGSVWSGNKNDGYDYENYLTRGDLQYIHDKYVGEDGKFDATKAKGTDFNMTNEEAEARGYYASGEYSAADMWAQDYVSGANDVYNTNVQNRKEANNYYKEENRKAGQGEQFTARTEDWYVKDDADGYDSRKGSLYTEYNWENDADPLNNRKAKRESGKTTEIEYRDSHVSNTERDQILSSGGYTMDQYKDQKNDFMKMDSVQQGFGTVEKDDGTAATYDEMTAAYEKYLEAKKEGKDIDKALTKEEKRLAKAYDENKEEIEDLTANHFEMNDGLQEVADNHEKWEEGLKKTGTQDYVDTLDGMRGAMGKILNVSPDLISDTLLTAENLDLMTKAAQGDESALNQLRMTASKEYLVTCGFNGDALKEGEAFINRWADSINNTEVGMTPQLNDGDFLAELWNMKKQTGMSIGQINNLLSQMGMEPKITMEKKEFDLPDVPLLKALTGGKKSFTIKVPKITVKKKSSTSTADFSGGGGGGGSSPGGTGGSSGGGTRLERRTIGKKDINEEVERYHTINNKLEDMEHKLNMIEKAKDRAFGTDKLKQMDKEADALEDQITLQKQYQAEIKKNLDNDRKKLEDLNIGIKFDENGTITNYKTVMEKAVNDYNSKRKAYNKKSAKDQKALDDKYKDKINPVTGEKYGSYENYLEAEYNKIKTAISTYEETQDLAKDVEEQIQDSLNQLYDLKLEKVQYQIELVVEANQDDLELLDFLMNEIGDDAMRAAEKIGYLGDSIANLESSFEAQQQGILKIFENHKISDTGMATIKDVISGGEDGVMSEEELNSMWKVLKAEGVTLTEAEIDQLRTSVSEMQQYAAEAREYQMEAIEAYTATFEAGMDKIDQYVEKFEHLSNVTENYKEIVDVIGNDKLGLSQATLDLLDNQGFDISKKSYETVHKQRIEAARELKDAQEQLKKAREDGDETLIAKWEAEVQEMSERVDELVESEQEHILAMTEQAMAAFERSMAKLHDQVSKTLSGLQGSLDALSFQFDLLSDSSNDYVEDYEKIYQLNKLSRDISQSIDDTSNVKAKQALLELEDEINQAKAKGNNLSEYDLDYLRKRYELKVAELALKEARDSKSQVRMTKDSEGNFNYVYTADESQVEGAEQSYEDKLYEMQQANAEYINELQRNLIDLQQSYASSFAEIGELYEKGSTEYKNALDNLQKRYGDQYKYITDQLKGSLGNNSSLYTNEVAEYAAMTGSKEMLDQEYVGSWEETTYSILTGYTSLNDATDDWNQATAQAYDDAIEAGNDYVERFTEITTYTKELIGEETQGISSAINQIKTDTEQNLKDVNSAITEIGENWTDVNNKMTAFQETYNGTITKLVTDTTRWSTAMNDVIQRYSELTDQAGENDDDDQEPAGDPPRGGGDPPRDGGRRGLRNRYTIRSGDTLSGIAYKLRRRRKINYGWRTLYRNNKDTIERAARRHGYRSSSGGHWIFPGTVLKYDTGGYTGSWGKEGRMAMLHQKELVLNEHDTANFLKAVSFVREISKTIDLNALSSMGGLSSGLHSTGVQGIKGDSLQQNVHITAEFPNATDKNTILEAFDNIVNLAAQYANRK